MDRRKFLGVAGISAVGLSAGELRARDLAGTRIVTPGTQLDGAPAVHTGGAPDILIIGAGVFGMFTAHYLRERGYDCMVVDQHGPGNSRATSGGETRGVRTSYGDRPHGKEWARWAKMSIERWKEWDARYTGTESPLFYTTGDIILREEEEPYLDRTVSQWDELEIPYEALSIDEVNRRWPVIGTEGMTQALYEPGAGVVRARPAIQSAATQYRGNGGEFVTARVTLGPIENGRLTGVVTDAGETLTAGSYVFACGPWLPKVFPELMGMRIRPRTLGHVFYFGTPAGDHGYEFPNLPSYGVPGGTGWPALPPDFRGFRARTGGHSHEDPDTSDRRVDEDGFTRGAEFVAKYFPALANQPVLETRACHYEGSVTRNFIVDHHPDLENVWITGGGSAEAFKQGPVLGDYIAHRLVGEDIDPVMTEGFKITDEVFDPDEGNNFDPDR